MGVEELFLFSRPLNILMDQESAASNLCTLRPLHYRLLQILPMYLSPGCSAVALIMGAGHNRVSLSSVCYFSEYWLQGVVESPGFIAKLDMGILRMPPAAGV